MKRVASPRFASRLARREVRRYAGRTTLLVVMIALAVAGAFVGSGLWAERSSDSDRAFEQKYGQAEGGALVDPTIPVATLLEELNVRQDTQTLLVREKPLGPWPAFATDIPIDDPLTKGIYELRRGRAPHAKNEVALTAPLLKSLNAHVGDSINFVIPAGTWKVTGEVRLRRDWSRSEAAFSSLADLRLPEVEDSPLPEVNNARLLIAKVRPENPKLPVNVMVPGKSGTMINGANNVATFEGDDGPLGAIVVCFAAVGLLIAAGFSASVNRQVRTAGLLSLNGATPPTIRRVGMLQGLWTGLFGTVIGLGLGTLVAILGRPAIEPFYERNLGSLIPPAVFLVAIPIISIAVSGLAGMYPARSLARMPTAVALAGRQPGIVRRSRRVLLAVGGIVVSVAAFAYLNQVARDAANAGSRRVPDVLVVAPLVSAVVGICILGPEIIGIVSRSRLFRMSLGLRVATRELARNRIASGTLVSAISVLMIGGGSVAITGQSRETVQRPPLQRDSMALVTGAGLSGASGNWSDTLLLEPSSRPGMQYLASQVHVVLPNARSIDVRALQLPANAQGNHWPILVATPELLDFIAVPAKYWPLLDEADVLAWNVRQSGGSVLPDVPLRSIEASQKGGEAGQRGAGFVREVEIPPSIWWTGGALLISEAAMQANNLEAVVIGKLFVNPTPLTETEDGVVSGLATSIQEDGSLARINQGQQCFCPNPAVETGRVSPEADYAGTTERVRIAAAVGAGLLAMGLIAMGFALRAVETRRENAVLSMIGARNRLLAGVAGWKAYVLAQIGTLLGGLTAAAVFQVTRGEEELNIKFLLILLFGIPIGIGLGAAACSAIALRLRPIRVEPSFAD